MSMVVAHMQKHTTGSACSGLFMHNERVGQSNTNECIVEYLTYENYELVNHNHITYNDIIKNKIDELGYGKNGNKKIRKDAVKMCSWIISSDQDFFKNLTKKEEKKFFISNLEYFEKKIGKENIISATVHKDETTPHMHLNLMPILNNKFNCKDLFNKKMLKEIQEELPIYLQNKGFEISRGKENSNAKHLNEIEFKIKKRLEDLNSLDNLIEKKTNLTKEIISIALNINTENLEKEKLVKTYNEITGKINNIDDSIVLKLKNLISKEKQELEKKAKSINKEILKKENNKKNLQDKIKQKQEILKQNKEKTSIKEKIEVKKRQL